MIIHPYQPIKVLHIDDDVNISRFLKSFLETFEKDIQVDTAASAKKAIEILEDTEFDCIISDYKMPDMNGIQLAQKIRDTSNVPIIIYTGQGSEEIAEKSVQEMMFSLTGNDINICPSCGKGKMLVKGEIPKQAGVCAKDIIRPPNYRKAA